MVEEINRIGTLLTKDILAELDKLWPDRLPDPTVSDRHLLITAAQRQVINTLHQRFEQANENLIDMKVIS